MTKLPTYICPQDFTLSDSPDLPYYPILGTIIAEPFNPTISLSKLDRPPPQTILTHNPESSNTTDTKPSDRSHDTTIWGYFCHLASTAIEGNRSKNTTPTWGTSTKPETRSYKPSDDEIAARIAAEPRVRDAMHSPVYIVTSIKVCKRHQMWGPSKQNIEGDGEGSGLVVPAEENHFDFETNPGDFPIMKRKSSLLVDHAEVIFAYQLHMIAEKGWREKQRRAMTRVREPGDVSLDSEYDDDNGDAEKWEISLASKDDIPVDEEVLGKVHAFELRGEDSQQAVCILLRPVDKK